MIKRFSKDAIIYVIANVFSKGINILVLPILTRILTPEEFGQIDTVIVTSGIVSVLIGLEIYQGLGRYYPESSLEKRQKLFTSGAVFLLSYVVLVLLLVIAGMSIYSVMGGGFGITKNTLVVCILYVITNVFLNYTQSVLRWEFKPILYSTISLFKTIVGFSIMMMLLPAISSKVQGYFGGIVAGNIIGLSMVLFIIRQRLVKVSFDEILQYSLIQIRFSLPLIVSSLAFLLNFYLDRISILYFLSFKELGLYGVSMRYATLVTVVFLGLRNSLMPHLYKNHAVKSTPKTIARIHDIVLCITGMVLCPLIIFNSEFFLLMNGAAFQEGSYVFPLLLLSVLYSNMIIFAPGMRILKKTRLIMFGSVLGLCVNLIFNIILVRYLGLLGIAISTAISSFVIFTYYLVLSHKLYPIPYKSKTLLSLPVILLFSIFVDNFHLNNANPYAFVFKISVVIISIGLLINIYVPKDYFKKLRKLT